MKRAKAYDREKALDAALELFWLKGYHATSLKDLEGTLGMKPGSIYAAFKSKEALYLASLERYARRFRDTMRQQVAEANSPLAALADLLRAFARPAGGDGAGRACMLLKTLLDATADDAAIAASARRYLDDMKAEIAGFFTRARDRGELPPDADVRHLALRYQADLMALRIEAHRGTDPGDLAALAESMAQDIERLRTRDPALAASRAC
ncbi:TetR/AcrR family transcriptional regulator [Rhodobium gokarnense]|uniref:AcrR family transcriptional regulator n=1 Tax=Rhodobium gokarnense TaxID=364296 RepID=A0ABT3HHE5_9HYPH|nr:TetR/AcrR family transcriptional regulator [Rhodobium gokarnense]MCW2309837.1 AcrR family transcriptional regulator [Rhodobium gokarnense]